MLDKGQKLDWFESDFIVTAAVTRRLRSWLSLSGNSPIATRLSICGSSQPNVYGRGGGPCSYASADSAASHHHSPLLQTNMGYTATAAGEIIAMTASWA